MGGCGYVDGCFWWWEFGGGGSTAGLSLSLSSDSCLIVFNSFLEQLLCVGEFTLKCE